MGCDPQGALQRRSGPKGRAWRAGQRLKAIKQEQGPSLRAAFAPTISAMAIGCAQSFLRAIVKILERKGPKPMKAAARHLWAVLPYILDDGR